MSESKAFLAGLVVLSAYLATAIWFATGQSIWTDETTQLRGLTLSFSDQLQWLMGRTGQLDAGLGVPPDRMPPISYWIGGLWSSVFGLTEMSLRLMGISAMALAAPALWIAGYRLAGSSGRLFLMAALFTAPGLIIVGGEIRTYPIFFCLAAWALWAYTGALLAETRRDRTRATTALTVFAILMAYAHFFGVVAGTCLFAGLVLHRLIIRLSVLPVLLATAITMLSWTGLAPFVMAAMGISDGPAPPTPALAEAVRDAVHFLIRLFADPVFLANHAALILLGLSIGLMGLFTLLRGFTGDRQRLAVMLALAVPGIASVTGLGVLNVLISGFETLRPSYSIWLIPFLFAFLTYGLGAGGVGRVAAFAGLALVVANLMATTTLLKYAPLYIHGAGEWLAARIEAPDDVLLVHDNRDPWGHSYFPVFHIEGNVLTQTVTRSDGSAFVFADMSVIPVADLETLQDGFDEAYRIRTIPLSGTDRAGIIRGEANCAETLARKLGTDPAPQAYCGIIGASLTPIR